MHGKKGQCKARRIPESREADGPDKGENRPGVWEKLCSCDTLATAQTGGGLLMQETARINYRNVVLSILIILIGVGSGINAGTSHKAELATGISSTAQVAGSLGMVSVMNSAPVVSYDSMSNTVAFTGSFVGGTIILVFVIFLLALVLSQFSMLGARGI